MPNFYSKVKLAIKYDREILTLEDYLTSLRQKEHEKNIRKKIIGKNLFAKERLEKNKKENTKENPSLS